jgi:uncharacterized protein YegP (UPF0339 family)
MARKNWRYKIEVLRSSMGGWYWRIEAPNGRILAHSESYSSKAKAIQTADSFFYDIGGRKKGSNFDLVIAG